MMTEKKYSLHDQTNQIKHRGNVTQHNCIVGQIVWQIVRQIDRTTQRSISLLIKLLKKIWLKFNLI